MPQVHTYIPEDVAVRLRREAEEQNTSISQIIANLIKREFADEWPAGYWESIAGNELLFLKERPDQGAFEVRDEAFPEITNSVESLDS